MPRTKGIPFSRKLQKTPLRTYHMNFVYLFDWGLTLFTRVPHFYDDGVSMSHCSMLKYDGKLIENLLKTTPTLT